MPAVFILLVVYVLPLAGDVHRQVTRAGHGVDVACFTDLHAFQGIACSFLCAGQVDAFLTLQPFLGLDHAVGQVGQALELLLDGRFLVVAIDLELAVVGVEQVDGEFGQMVEVIHAGLGDAEMRLSVADPANHRADQEQRHEHQRQDDDGHLPADAEVVDELEEVTTHNRIRRLSETRRLCVTWEKKARMVMAAG